MKQYLFHLAVLVCCINLLALPAFGQRKPVPFTVTAYKSLENPLGWKGLPIDVTVMIKDAQGNVIYTETHSDTLNDIAEAKINIGEGQNQSPMYDQAPIDKGKWLCNTVTVKDPAGDVVIMTEDVIGQNMFSAYSENSAGVGNVVWTNDPVAPMDLFVPPQDVTFCVPTVRKNITGSRFSQILMSDYLVSRTKPSAVDETPLSYLHIGTGNPCPSVFGRASIDELENFYTFYPGPLAKYYNAFSVRVPQELEPYGHSTSAIFAENIYDPLGVGLFARGRNQGTYNEGKIGTFGLTNSTVGFGIGAWGLVQNGAPTGTGNYALLGSANNQANSYGLYSDGDVFVNGDIMQSSDRCLKTNIQTSAYGLNALMQLRPMTYEFVTNTTYSLPDGEHIGFIAQEVEEVIPSIVSDIPLPKSLDPELINTSGSTTIKGINYTALIPVMTKAIQELNEKVELLTAEVDRLNKALAADNEKK